MSRWTRFMSNAKRERRFSLINSANSLEYARVYELWILFARRSRQIHTRAHAHTRTHCRIIQHRLFHFNINVVRLPVIIATYTFALHDTTTYVYSAKLYTNISNTNMRIARHNQLVNCVIGFPAASTVWTVELHIQWHANRTHTHTHKLIQSSSRASSCV